MVVAATASRGIELVIMFLQVRMLEQVTKITCHVFKCGDECFGLIKLLVLAIFTALPNTSRTVTTDLSQRKHSSGPAAHKIFSHCLSGRGWNVI